MLAMSDGTKSESRHFTLRPGFALLVGLFVLALYFLWAAYGAAPTSLSFLTETPDEHVAVTPMAGMDVESASMERMAMNGHGVSVGAMTPGEFHEITTKFAEDLGLPDGSVRPTREWMEAVGLAITVKVRVCRFLAQPGPSPLGVLRSADRPLTDIRC
jgi:hypothetical protein